VQQPKETCGGRPGILCIAASSRGFAAAAGLPDESSIEGPPVRIRPLLRVNIPRPPDPPQPDPAIQGADSGASKNPRVRLQLKTRTIRATALVQLPGLKLMPAARPLVHGHHAAIMRPTLSRVAVESLSCPRRDATDCNEPFIVQMCPGCVAQ
jgi:hypothetical protein